MRTLYQMPISHFCEKIRWALDYKQLDYRIHNLLPGFHVRTTKKLTGQTSVPILVDGDQIVHGSSRIITYLDQTYPERSLTPEDPRLCQEALDWETYADANIGMQIRLVCYDVLLDHPNLLIPMFTQGGPWYGKPLMKWQYPMVSRNIRKYMGITEASVTEASLRMCGALEAIEVHRGGRALMVGKHFSRADLSIAALLAPLFRPAGYGLQWPAHYPPELQTTVDRLATQLAWPAEIYRKYRQPE